MLALGRSAVIAGMAAVMVGLPAGSAVAAPAGTGAAAPAVAPFVGPWAGYIDANPAAAPVFRLVNAFFRIPPLNCGVTPNATAIQGVSFDGYLDATMEQAGVEGTCAHGIPSEQAGWQMPHVPPLFHGQFAPNTGDVVRATVAYNRQNATYTLAVTDLNTGQHFAVLKKCAACDNSSAEVITQAAPPHGAGGILADFGKVVFDNITVSDYGACPVPRPLVRPACWQTVPATMAAVPPTHHATAGPVIGGTQFGNVWAAVP